MNIDWSAKGHGLPKEALRASDNLKLPGGVKVRASRIAWERAEAGMEPFFIFTAQTEETTS